MSDRRGWGFNKTIGFGEVVVAASMLVSVVVMQTQMQGRIDAQQAAIHRTEEIVAAERRFRDAQRAEDRAATEQQFTLVRGQLVRVEDKLDGIRAKL